MKFENLTACGLKMIIYSRYGIVGPCYTISIVLIHHPSSGTWLEVSVFGVCLVRIFPHSIFSPNAGKRLTRKTPNTDTFYALLLFKEGSIILKKYPIKILTLFLQYNLHHKNKQTSL